MDHISSVEDIIQDAKNGKMFILTDDENRENEGDLVIPAQFATHDKINFMARYGRGLICMPIIQSIANKLKLEPMVQNNTSKYGTAFTASIGAKYGITTGISAFDRAKTVQVAIDQNSTENDITIPGHIFPLIAKSGGVLERSGHTEAAVDISILANLQPAAVLCEIMNDDGTMARMPDLIKFATLHHLNICSIENLISYRKSLS